MCDIVFLLISLFCKCRKIPYSMQENKPILLFFNDITCSIH
ncbi:hypothetical protein HMPREF3226_01523 [Prevotella corporis]|uniref:Uncharacterized protein n=1 Tax=Prevotella corporis TaxID=28128 RepID=A0A133Q711_9BACT|nr:hypothetical protein HMPREF3226_01523 [Prevotella corporis]